jgi:hypothetical protein
MKNKKQAATKTRVGARPIFHFDFSEYVLDGLAKLSQRFPAYDATRGRLSDQENQGYMANRLIVLGLAHVDKTAPLLMATIKYCEAEGINQEDHSRGLAEAKFRKKLYVVKGANR